MRSRTGRQVVQQALAAGHDVTAVARRPEAVTLRHRRLTVMGGDVLERETVLEPVVGADAVISALGVHRRGPTRVYSAGTGHIVEAMQTGGVRRLVCLSSAGATPNPASPVMQRLLVRLITELFYPDVYADMRRMEDLLGASTLDWTVIRAPGLTNGPRTGRYVSAVNRHVPRQRSLPRADVAEYILTHRNDPETYRAWIELARKHD